MLMKQFNELNLQGRLDRITQELDKDRTINKTKLSLNGVKCEVSTVSLPPLFDGSNFETMIFNGEFNGKCWRYETEQDAKSSHDEIVKSMIKMGYKNESLHQ